MTDTTFKKTPRLGVNIDHIATIREARRTFYPDPYKALAILRRCEVDQVTLHLREDRRHIHDQDLIKIIAAKILPVNLELAVVPEMIKIACHQKPDTVTFVPERREEVTTEGGLDCVAHFKKVNLAVQTCEDLGIRTRLFIDADSSQVAAASTAGAEAIEFHTGCYCAVFERCYQKHGHMRVSEDVDLAETLNTEFEKMKLASQEAKRLGLKVFAGHGLTLDNLPMILNIAEIEEYNIGHAIMAHAVFVGLEQSIKDYQKILSGE